jgi:hypothetical protein
MGYRRGGLYSYDWLDLLFGYLDRPSADRIIPAFQHLKIGDEIPIGRGRGFPVTALDPNRALVLSGKDKGVKGLAVRFVPDRRPADAAGVAQQRPHACHSWLVAVDAGDRAGGVPHDAPDASWHPGTG